MMSKIGYTSLTQGQFLVQKQNQSLKIFNVLGEKSL